VHDHPLDVDEHRLGDGTAIGITPRLLRIHLVPNASVNYEIDATHTKWEKQISSDLA
jgi:hypothetical protein